MAINPISFPTPQAFSGGADFAPLANLGNVYREAQNREKLSDLGKQLAAGTINYQQAAGKAADLGDMKASLAFLGLSEEQKKLARNQEASATLAKNLGTLYGGGADSAPAAAPAVAPAAVVPVADTDPTAPIRTNPNGTIAGNIATQPVGGAPPVVNAPPVANAAPVAPVAPAPVAPAPVAPAPVAPVAAPVPPDSQKKFAFLLANALNPNLDDKSRAVVNTLLGKTLDEMKTPEKVQVLQALKDSDPNFKGSLLDLEIKLRNAGKTDVNILPGERAYDVAQAKELVDMYSGINKASVQASKTKGTLDIMERATKDPNFYSGTGSAGVLAYNRAATALGFEPADKSTSTEVFQKMSNKLVTDVAGGGGAGLGTGISNADRDFISNTVPNLQNTKAGNQAIIDIMRKVSDRDVEIGQRARAYAKSHNGRIDYEFISDLSDWSEKNPLFKDVKIPREAMTAAPAAAAPAAAPAKPGWKVEKVAPQQ